MKTPREILVARHKAVEPKLDDIRQDVMAKLNDKDGASRAAQKAQSFSGNLVSILTGCPGAIWHELIWPSRRIWGGLAAVWILILTANFSMRDQTESKMARSQPSQGMILSFRQQQQLLSELLGQDDPPVAEAKKSYLPRPASERQVELLIT